MAFCDYCECRDCRKGRKGLTHAATHDGKWICDVCYHYECCVSASDHQKGKGPCEITVNGKVVSDPNCPHRPKLISPFVL